MTDHGCMNCWEARYQSGDLRWEKGEPSPGLVDFLAAHPELPRGTVAVPGCGTGNDVLAWERAGFRAAGFDLAPTAVQRATERMQAAGTAACIALADFLRGSPPVQPFDWLFEHTLFCAIEPADRELYVQAVLRWLKPGGHYLAVNYFFPQHPAGETGPPHPTSCDEQLARFGPHFDLLADWVPRSYANRVGRERMFWWRRRAATA